MSFWQFLLGLVGYIAIAALIQGAMQAYVTWPSRHTFTTVGYSWEREYNIKALSIFWPVLPVMVVLGLVWILGVWVIELFWDRAKALGYKLVLMVEPEGEMDRVMRRK